MSEVIVGFWTGTGNTAEMAEYVAEGIREGGAEAKVVSVDDISAADLKDAAAFALGCPSMGVEQLEESVMEPFVEEVCGFASGKTIGLFGAYGWGEVECMRNWVDQMEGAGAKVVGTGRSDFPNQVNNVIAFPGIFRGALEAHATQITEEMKLAVAEALAALVSDKELNEDFIMPEAFDPRVAEVVSQAVKSHVK